jgi:hypothetical protein
MKVLFLVENYYGFYTRYLLGHPELQKESYERQCSILFEQAFYQSDSYANGLRRLGHETSQVIMDCYPLQYKWANEHGLFKMLNLWHSCRPWNWCWISILRQSDIFEWYRDKILLEQIKRVCPDILYVFSGVPVNEKLLSDAKRYARYLVCQWSCPTFENYPFNSYDLIITSTKFLVKYFKGCGHNTEYLQQAFDERISDKINTDGLREGIVFAGSIIPDVHRTRMVLLEYLSRNIDFDFYGAGVDYLPESSPLRKKFRGEAFGLDMYRIYSRYKIAIHSHAEITGNFVGAKRLFEITGAGAMLLTDVKEDLDNFFEIGSEAVTYTDPCDCLSKLRYYLTHEDERAKIAKAGQRRTLRDHAFVPRMKELSVILEKHFRQ